MAIFIIIIFCLFLVIIYIKKNHLHIDYKSFIEEGFTRIENAFGISCYCGKQGTGKTYSAIKFIEEQKDNFGYRIITNVYSYCYLVNKGSTLDDYIKGKTNAKYLYEPDILKIIDYCSTFKENDEKILIFFDEIFSVLEQRGALRRDVLAFLSQLRKRNILFITTAQEWSEINITFRRYVRFQITCCMKSIPFSHKAWLINSINDGDQIHWDEQEQDFVAPVIQMNVSKGLKRIIELYDTFETISNTQILNKSRF